MLGLPAQTWAVTLVALPQRGITRTQIRSGCLSVKPKHAGKPIGALNLTPRFLRFIAWLNQPVLQFLMVSLHMKMDKKLADGISQRFFPKENGVSFILHLIPQLGCKVHEIYDDAPCWGEPRAIGRPVFQTGDAWHWLVRRAKALFCVRPGGVGMDPISRAISCKVSQPLCR
jgi:hypothetical protein